MGVGELISPQWRELRLITTRKGIEVGWYLPRFKGDLNLFYIGTLIEDGEGEVLVGLIELVSRGGTRIGRDHQPSPKHPA